MSEAQQRHVFGDFELDVATRQLRRSGEVIALQPRVFDLLAFLIEQRERAVDKDAIQDAVWGNVIVSETALTRAIMKARRAVDDDAEQQAVIRTVHGHGYQFVATLQDLAREPEPASRASTPAEAETDAPPDAAPAGRPIRLLLLAAAALLVVAVALVWRQPAASESTRLAIMPVMNDTDDSEYDFARLGLMGLANGLFTDNGLLATVRAADVMQYVDNVGWTAGDSSVEHARALRDAYGASHMLVPTLSREVGGLRLSFALIDSSGQRAQSTMVGADTGSLVRGMVRETVRTLGGSRHALAGAQAPVDQDPFINEAYARALSSALEGRCADALPLFDVVLSRQADLPRARLERANCQYRLGQWEEAEAAYRAMVESMSARDNPSVQAAALAGLGKVLHRSGQHDAASSAYRQSLAIAETENDKEAIGRVLISMAILAKDHRDFAEARKLLARSTLMFRQLEWTQLPGQIFSTQANIAMNDGKLEEAEEHLNQALASFRAVGDRRHEAMMLNNYGFLRRQQGRFSEAEPLHLQSLEIRRDIGDTVGQGRILGMLSILYLRDGRTEEALAAAAQAVEIAREANDALFIAGGLAQLGAAQLAVDQLAAARLSFTEAQQIYEQINDESRSAQVRLRLADIDVREGAIDDALARIEAVMAEALEKDLPEPAIESMQRRGQLLVTLNRRDEAVTAYEGALALIASSGVTEPQAEITMQLAGLYLDAGDTRAAEPLLGYVVEQEATAASLKLRARYAELTGNVSGALKLLASAKIAAPAEWSELDEEAVQRVTARADNGVNP